MSDDDRPQTTVEPTDRDRDLGREACAALARATWFAAKLAGILASVSAALVWGVYIVLGAPFVPYALAGAIMGSLFIGWVASAISAQEKDRAGR